MRRTRLKQRSGKRKKRMASVAAFRRALMEQTGNCMLCGTSPVRPRHRLPQHNMLCCHEVLNGPLRDKCLDERSCLIVACWKCNGDELNSKGEYPLARQLAIIKAKAPERYDLSRVLFLRHPPATKFVTEDEVDEWLQRDYPDFA